MLANYTSGAAGGSGYNITIEFIGMNWTDELQAGFIRAADYVSSIITGDVNNETRDFGDGQGTRTIDDLEVSAELKQIDGAGGTLGFAGPDMIRSDVFFPITGEMNFDYPDAQNYVAADAANGTDSWDDLILHEMLHTIGFGTIWDKSGLITNVGSAAVPDFRFTGLQARNEYQILYPGKYLDDPNADKGVPIESDEGGAGTVGGHWDNGTLPDTLMSGFLDAKSEISNLTIAALDDMGYETTYTVSDVVCFVRGTKLTTDLCQMAVEDLAVGDLIDTVDNGLQTIRWIGSRQLDAIDLAQAPNLLPIKISAGCLGFGTPHRDLFVSPQHRMLITSIIAKNLFNNAEVLVAAKDLLDLDGVEIVQTSEVEYFHILFDDHQLVVANGAVTESLYTGTQAMKSLPAKSVAEITALFPELRDTDAIINAARPLIAKRDGITKMLDIHAQLCIPLVDKAFH